MKNYLLYMASALLLLTACNSSDENPAAANGQQQEDGIPIMLQAGVKQITRAANDIQNKTFDKGVAIKIRMYTEFIIFFRFPVNPGGTDLFDERLRAWSVRFIDTQ